MKGIDDTAFMEAWMSRGRKPNILINGIQEQIHAQHEGLVGAKKHLTPLV